MKITEKWKEKNKEQKERKAKDIEYCRQYCKQHPAGFKIMGGLFVLGFSVLIVFMIFSGAYPLAIIASVFTVWMGWAYIKIYRDALPGGKVTL